MKIQREYNFSSINKKVTIIFDDEKDKERIRTYQEICARQYKAYLDSRDLFCLSSRFTIAIIFSFPLFILFNIKISLFCLLFICSILIDIICFNYVKINEKYARMWDADYYCEERIKEIDNLLKYDDYKVEYSSGYWLTFCKYGVPPFHLTINTQIPDEDFYIELYTGSSGCPRWIVYTSFYERYNLLLR